MLFCKLKGCYFFAPNWFRLIIFHYVLSFNQWHEEKKQDFLVVLSAPSWFKRKTTPNFSLLFSLLGDKGSEGAFFSVPGTDAIFAMSTFSESVYSGKKFWVVFFLLTLAVDILLVCFILIQTGKGPWNRIKTMAWTTFKVWTCFYEKRIIALIFHEKIWWYYSNYSKL